MRKLLSFLMAVILLSGLGFVSPAHAISKTELAAAIASTQQAVYKAVKNPQVGTIGGEWAVLGLTRSNYNAPKSYYEKYYKNVANVVKTNQGLPSVFYTDYSRVVLALTAVGYDPRDVSGYDLTLPLGDFEKTMLQGINGAIFALIALDSADYAMPQNTAAKTQATRDLYITAILTRQLPDGGFALGKSQTVSDVDITAMALQALANYQDRADVKAAISHALSFLSSTKAGWNANCESTVQVIVALSELGIGVNDARFIVNNKTLPDELMKYKVSDKGFARTAGGDADQMSTEQALYALAAAYRFESNLPGIFDMTAPSLKKPQLFFGLL